MVLIPSLILAIQHHFHVSDAAFGLFYLLGSLSYGVGSVAGGMVAERVGQHVVLPASALLSGLCLAAGTATPGWPPFMIVVALSGAGRGGMDGGVNALFLDVFRDNTGRSLNLLHGFFGVGALVTPIPLGLLVTLGVGWQALFLVTAAAYCALAAILALLPLPRTHHHHVPEGAGDRGLGVAIPFLGLSLAIAAYVAAEVGVGNWLVRYLSAQPLVVGTAALSTFWGGLASGRLLSGWVAERWPYRAFTTACIALASLALAGAVLSPWLIPAFALYGLAGLFYGPVYPMIMAIGGLVYPRRLATLAGSLTTAGSAGSIIYPPLMGLMASGVGLQIALLGAAALGILSAGGVLASRVRVT